jgi:GNAT superfamily N-acetyltransferase
MIGMLVRAMFGEEPRVFAFNSTEGRIEVPPETLQWCAKDGHGLAKALHHLNVVPQRAVFCGLSDSTLPPDVAFEAARSLMMYNMVTPRVNLVPVTPTNVARVLGLQARAGDDNHSHPAHILAAAAYDGKQTSKVLAITCGDAIVGVLHYAPSGEIVNLHDVFVDARFRRFGIATAALQLFTQYAYAYHPQQRTIMANPRVSGPVANGLMAKVGFADLDLHGGSVLRTPVWFASAATISPAAENAIKEARQPPPVVPHMPASAL